MESMAPNAVALCRCGGLTRSHSATVLTLRSSSVQRRERFERKGAGVIMSAARRVAQASLPTRCGTFETFVYDTPEHKEHVAFT
jgi:hypothetical protein